MDKSEENSESSPLNTPQFSFKSKEATRYIPSDEFIGEFSPENMQDKYSRALLEARSSDFESFDELENADYVHREDDYESDLFNQTGEQMGNESKEFITDMLLNSPEESSKNLKSEFLESRFKLSKMPLIEDDLALSESWKSLRNLDKGKVQEIAKLKKELKELKDSLIEEQDEISILKAEHPMEDMEKYLREQDEMDSFMDSKKNLQSSSEEEIKNYYENLLKERLEEERRKITREISNKLQSRPESSYSSQPVTRRPLAPESKKKQLNTLDEMELLNYKENLQIEYQMKLFTEKESWNTELTPIVIQETQREIEKSLKCEIDSYREASLKKAMLDANSMVDKIKADTDESLAKSFAHLESQFDSEFERAREQIWAETIEKLRYDQEYKLKQELMEKMRDNITLSIRNELAEPIKQEVKNNLSNRIRREIQRDFEEKFRALKEKCETETQSKILNMQENFSKSHNEEVIAKVSEVLVKKEKDLQITYMKNLEKNKQNLQREISSQYDKDIKEAKEIVNEIRSEVARLKSNLNINMKKLSSTRAQKLQDIKKQHIELERKMKNAEIQQRNIDESFSIVNVPKKCIPSKSPIRERSSILCPNSDSDFPEKNTPVPHRVPMLISSQDTRIDPDYLLNSASIKPPSSYTYSGKVPPNSLKSTLDSRQMHPCINRKVIEQAPNHDLVAELIMKNLEEAKQQAIRLLKDTERPGPLYYKSIHK